jgi:phosphopantetheine adenylyltransferase
MKYFKRLKIYKNGSGRCSFDPSTFNGYSYDAQISARIGKFVVYDDGSFSPITSGHQSEICLLAEKYAKKNKLEFVSVSIGESWHQRISKEMLKDALKREYEALYRAQAKNLLRKRCQRDESEYTGTIEKLERIPGVKVLKAVKRDLKYSAEYAEIKREYLLLKGQRKLREYNKKFKTEKTVDPITQAKEDLLNSSFSNV